MFDTLLDTFESDLDAAVNVFWTITAALFSPSFCEGATALLILNDEDEA